MVKGLGSRVLRGRRLFDGGQLRRPVHLRLVKGLGSRVWGLGFRVQA